MNKIVFAVTIFTFSASISLAECVDNSGIERTKPIEPTALGGCSLHYPSFEFGYEFGKGENIGASLMFPFQEEMIRHGTLFSAMELGLNLGDSGISSRTGFQKNSFVSVSSVGYGIGLLNEIDWGGEWKAGYYVDAHFFLVNFRLKHSVIPVSEVNFLLGLRI